jgi:hypothetical protein
MNRIDKVVVFRSLRSEQLNEICEIELEMVQRRVLQSAKEQFLFQVTQPAKDFMLREGTNTQYGARHLKRAIERYVTCPLASLLATEQVVAGDVILIDWDGKENGLRFWKDNAGRVPSATARMPEPMSQAAAAGSDNRGLTLPLLKTKVAEPALTDGAVGSGPHRQADRRVSSRPR